MKGYTIYFIFFSDLFSVLIFIFVFYVHSYFTLFSLLHRIPFFSFVASLLQNIFLFIRNIPIYSEYSYLFITFLFIQNISVRSFLSFPQFHSSRPFNPFSSLTPFLSLYFSLYLPPTLSSPFPSIPFLSCLSSISLIHFLRFSNSFPPFLSPFSSFSRFLVLHFSI